MKALGLPPTDPRLAKMTEVQWQWCIFQTTIDLDEDYRREFNSLFLQIGAHNPAMATELRRVFDSNDPGSMTGESAIRSEWRRRRREIRKSGGTAGKDEEMAAMLAERRATRGRPAPAEPQPEDYGFDSDFVEDP